MEVSEVLLSLVFEVVVPALPDAGRWYVSIHSCHVPS